MSQWVNSWYPDAFFTPKVRYTSVVGKLIRGDCRGSLKERQSYVLYKGISGDGAVWGDGLVPLVSGLLHGSHQIILNGVSHFSVSGGAWYGQQKVTPEWWNAAMGHNNGKSQIVAI
jgi:hypothetical protein